ncbi:hypothetical protein VDGD_21530 [Verticillium dahliae]|nr:hypothetical protein VDGD_21530 [Verticillium dahliae]
MPDVVVVVGWAMPEDGRSTRASRMAVSATVCGGNSSGRSVM